MPIDIGSGKLYFDESDLSIQGKKALDHSRHFCFSLSDRIGIFGRNWNSSFESELRDFGGYFEFLRPDGSTERFDFPGGVRRPRELIRKLGSFLELELYESECVVTQWNVDNGEISRFVFDRIGKKRVMPLKEVRTVDGHSIALIYDGGVLKEAIQVLENRRLLFVYNSNRLIDRIELISSDGTRYGVSRFEYDNELNLVASFNATETANRYEYDSVGRVLRQNVSDGGFFSYRYDDQNRCTHVSGIEGFRESRLKYLDKVFMVEVADSYRSVTRYSYREDGQITQILGPCGAVEQWEYDEFGRIKKRIGPTGSSLILEYDEMGNVKQTIDAVGSIRSYTFNDCHLPIRFEDNEGGRWQLEYDSMNRLISSTDATNNKWMYDYDSYGNISTIVNPEGDSQRFLYRQGVLESTIDAEGNRNEVVFDDFGRLVGYVNAAGEKYTFIRNKLGQVITVVLPDDSKIHAHYDEASNLLKVEDQLGRNVQQRFTNCGRILERIDKIGNKVRFEWGTEPDRLRSVVNEKGERFRFDHDEGGKCIAEVGFDGKRTEYAYDLNGNCRLFKNSRGEVRHYFRDSLGRVVSIRNSNGEELAYKYDSNGNMLSASCAGAEVIYVRDKTGLVKEEIHEIQGKKHSIVYKRNKLGNLLSLSSSLGFDAEFDIDANGMWRRVTLRNGEEVTIRRDVLGREFCREINNVCQWIREYDEVGRVKKQIVRNAKVNSLVSDFGKPLQVPLLIRTYIRDKSGYITRIIDEKSRTANVRLDEKGRIKEWVGLNGNAIGFQYDEFDNVTSMEYSIGSITQKKTCLVENNRVVAYDGHRIEYDEIGRRIMLVEENGDVPRVSHYNWDGFDQLSSFTTDGVECRYTYDALGRRTSKVFNEQKTLYFWIGNVPFCEYDVEKQSASFFLFCQNSFEPMLYQRDGQNFYAITNPNGSVLQFVDARGKPTDESFDELIDCEHSRNRGERKSPFGYQGQYKDEESGLYYNLFRYYDPQTLQYISQDPIGVIGGLNLYKYVTNPLHDVDLVGLAPPCQKEKDRAKKAAQKTMEDAADGKVRKRPDYHGRLPDDVVASILANPDAVFLSEGSGGRMIFAKGGNVVVTEGPGSNRGQAVTSYGPAGPRGQSGAAIFGGVPTDPGQPVTPQMITAGTIPTPSGGVVPPGHQVWP